MSYQLVSMWAQGEVDGVRLKSCELSNIKIEGSRLAVARQRSHPEVAGRSAREAGGGVPPSFSASILLTAHHHHLIHGGSWTSTFLVRITGS